MVPHQNIVEILHQPISRGHLEANKNTWLLLTQQHGMTLRPTSFIRGLPQKVAGTRLVSPGLGLPATARGGRFVRPLSAAGTVGSFGAPAVSLRRSDLHFPCQSPSTGRLSSRWFLWMEKLDEAEKFGKMSCGWTGGCGLKRPAGRLLPPSLNQMSPSILMILFGNKNSNTINETVNIQTPPLCFLLISPWSISQVRAANTSMHVAVLGPRCRLLVPGAGACGEAFSSSCQKRGTCDLVSRSIGLFLEDP